MQDLRFLVEIIPYTMPTELAHYRIAVTLSKLLDCCTNVTKSTTWLDAFNTFLLSFPTNLYQFIRLLTRCTDKKGAAGIPMKAFKVGSDIQVDNVTIT